MTKEVFFHHSYLGERLLYKFGLDIGDSVTVTSLACDQITMIITNVDTITDLMGTQRRKMLVDYWYDAYDEYWIDGIGSTLGLLTAGNIRCIADYNQDLLCFKQFDDLVYMNPMYSKCHITQVSIKESTISNEPIKINPHPVAGTSHIVIDNQKIKSYNLFDFSGRLVTESTQAKIEKGNLKPGIYFLSVETVDGNIYTTKVLIQ